MHGIQEAAPLPKPLLLRLQAQRVLQPASPPGRGACHQGAAHRLAPLSASLAPGPALRHLTLLYHVRKLAPDLGLVPQVVVQP